MIKVTSWRPDTCECEIEYQWDTNDPQDTRTHTLKSIISCTIHRAIVGSQNQYSEVIRENQDKNKTLALIAESVSRLSNSVIDDMGIQRGFQLKREYIDAWSFDVNRNLVIAIPQLTAAEKTFIRQGLAAIGITKVIIQ